MVNERDREILNNILVQCKIMEKALVKYKLSPNLLSDDGFLFNACCETLFEIGEQVKRISKDFILNHPEQPWRDIAGMRDKIGHHYGDLKLMMLWTTINKDLSALKITCEQALARDD